MEIFSKEIMLIDVSRDTLKFFNRDKTRLNSWPSMPAQRTPTRFRSCLSKSGGFNTWSDKVGDLIVH